MKASSLPVMPPPPRRSVAFSTTEPDTTTSGTSNFQAHVVAKLKQQQQQQQQQPQPQPDTNNSAASTTTTGLTHLQNNWPGQTGNGHHLDVRPMSFDQLLAAPNQRIVIPLFQRRYCWTKAQIHQWWLDVSSKTGGQQQHSTHKTMFRRKKDDGTLICIDGQQRLTTTTLFLVALRAQARRHHHQNTSNLVRKIDTVLFSSADALAGLKRWAKYQAFQLIRNGCDHQDATSNTYIFTMPSQQSGWLPPFETTLTPSYIDRAAYFEILCRDYILEELEKQLSAENNNTNSCSVNVVLPFSPTCQESVQYMAFDIFATQLSQLIGSVVATKPSHVASTLHRLYHKQLVGFSIMYIELLTDDNPQQIFLWMQEKSVFGMGRLLHNPHPGVDFTPVDLARNLVVSSVMMEPLVEQVQFYQSCWICPLEERFGTAGVSRILYQLVHQYCRNNNSRYVGDMEEKLLQYKAATPTQMQNEMFADDKPMMIYGRFHSYVQHRAVQLEGGNPHAITRQVADSIVRDMVAVGESMGL